MAENEMNVIKKIREALYLSQTEFGAGLGYSKSAVGAWEIGANPLSPKVKHAICTKYHVTREFINTGTGIMFEPNIIEDANVFTELQSIYNLTDEDIRIIKSYISLNKSSKKAITELFKGFEESS